MTKKMLESMEAIDDACIGLSGAQVVFIAMNLIKRMMTTAGETFLGMKWRCTINSHPGLFSIKVNLKEIKDEEMSE